MNNNGQLDFIDVLSMMSFCVSIMNFGMNVTQNDIVEQTAEIDKKVNEHINDVLNEIHAHLKSQDIKLSAIEKRLEELTNDSR